MAEQRFRRDFDQPSGVDVVPALRAFQNANESGERDLARDEVTWPSAEVKAFDFAHVQTRMGLLHVVLDVSPQLLFG